MKKVVFAALTAVALSSAALPAMADIVNGYIKQNGTYVAPYIRSAPGTCVYGGCR
jgi:opacity protein-like surface antigen